MKNQDRGEEGIRLCGRGPEEYFGENSEEVCIVKNRSPHTGSRKKDEIPGILPV